MCIITDMGTVSSIKGPVDERLLILWAHWPAIKF